MKEEIIREAMSLQDAFDIDDASLVDVTWGSGYCIIEYHVNGIDLVLVNRLDGEGWLGNAIADDGELLSMVAECHRDEAKRHAACAEVLTRVSQP